MAYKSSYTSAVIDEILDKSKSFSKNDESWTMISSSIATLDVSNVMKPGNYIYSGNLFIPEMDPLYGYTKTTKESMTLTGNYMIFVRRINFNIYQFISAHSIHENNDDTIIIVWIRQTNYNYIPKIYYSNEPSNSIFGFATSETYDKGINKYPNQLRKFDNTEIKYYDLATNKYETFIGNDSMTTTIYGSIDNIFNIIDNSFSIANSMKTHNNDNSIHITSTEKASYDSKLLEDDVVSTLDDWKTTFLADINSQIASIKSRIDAATDTVSINSSNLNTHINDTIKHPTAAQITNWDSKANADHTHSEDEITISSSDIIGIIKPENISDDAKEIQVNVSSISDMLSLTKSDIHNGCWVLVKSEASSSIVYYVVVDDTKLGTMKAFQQLTANPYESSDLVWENIKNKPTTVDELGAAVSNLQLDSMITKYNNTTSNLQSKMENLCSDVSNYLNSQDSSSAMENLIDLIDYKLQLIESLALPPS